MHEEIELCHCFALKVGRATCVALGYPTASRSKSDGCSTFSSPPSARNEVPASENRTMPGGAVRSVGPS